jgi:hypothetical protein
MKSTGQTSDYWFSRELQPYLALVAGVCLQPQRPELIHGKELH